MLRCLQEDGIEKTPGAPCKDSHPARRDPEWYKEKAEEEAALVAALAKTPEWGNALHSRWSHRPDGGTLHTAASRIPGNSRWPEYPDDSRNSLLTSSLTR